jgi:hypothetical protein
VSESWGCVSCFLVQSARASLSASALVCERYWPKAGFPWVAALARGACQCFIKTGTVIASRMERVPRRERAHVLGCGRGEREERLADVRRDVATRPRVWPRFHGGADGRRRRSATPRRRPRARWGRPRAGRAAGRGIPADRARAASPAAFQPTSATPLAAGGPKWKWTPDGRCPSRQTRRSDARRCRPVRLREASARVSRVRLPLWLAAGRADPDQGRSRHEAVA